MMQGSSAILTYPFVLTISSCPAREASKTCCRWPSAPVSRRLLVRPPGRSQRQLLRAKRRGPPRRRNAVSLSGDAGPCRRALRRRRDREQHASLLRTPVDGRRSLLRHGARLRHRRRRVQGPARPAFTHRAARCDAALARDDLQLRARKGRDGRLLGSNIAGAARRSGTADDSADPGLWDTLVQAGTAFGPQNG
jgi:hypothetical protein